MRNITVLKKKGYIYKEYSQQIESQIGVEKFGALLEILSDTNIILKDMKGENSYEFG